MENKQIGINVKYLPKYKNKLASINLNNLILNGVKGIIIDLDNTIISEDDKYLSPHAEGWIQEAKNLGILFYILSNGKRRYRVEYWSGYLDIPATSPAKKPFPNAFYRAMMHMKIRPSQVLVIGDSRHTDMLGAWIVGCRSIQVASLPHPLRWWEKLAGELVQMPYPTEKDLWKFSPSDHYKNT